MTAGGSDNGDFEAQARKYWDAWSQAMRQGGGAAPAAGQPGQPGPDAVREGWCQAVDWWARSLPSDTTSQAQDTAERFRDQTGDWFGLMQQVARQFAGRDSSSAEVADAWRQAVSAQGESFMHSALGTMRGGSLGGFDPLLKEAAQMLGKWHTDNAQWLEMPAFGLGRNQQSRWQALAKAQQDYQERAHAYAGQLKAAIERAFGVFEAKLTEHETAGSQLGSVRALFDLWIEAAEEAYSTIALSEEFGQVYAAFANADMRLRAALQLEIEQLSERFGMPTRSEMDTAHRRIAELERTVRKMAAANAAAGARAADGPSTTHRQPGPRGPVRAKAANKAPGKPAARTAAKGARKGSPEGSP